MDRTIDVSGWPTLVVQFLLSSFLVFGGLFLVAIWTGGLLTRLGIELQALEGLTGIGVFAVLWLTLTGLWVKNLRQADGAWWRPVPQAQYLGRFAGHGGLARHSWERAVERLPNDDEDERTTRESER